MPMNRIQFQPGLSLANFLEHFGTQAQCEAALESARWPEGFRCPRCGEARHSRFRVEGRLMFQCSACRKQTSLTARTLFHHSHLALRVWMSCWRCVGSLCPSLLTSTMRIRLFNE